MKRLILIGFILLALWKLTESSDYIVLSPGVKVNEAPLQQDIIQAVPFAFKNHTISPLARFSLQAKVLAKQHYYLGPESQLSPVDLALGWGPMSDQAIVDEIQFSQSGRWYRWSVQAFPIPKRAIEVHSANMHIMPSADWITNKLQQVKQGQIIALAGYLVRADADEGNWHWQSSLTREDVGAGACELFYITDLEIIE